MADEATSEGLLITLSKGCMRNLDNKTTFLLRQVASSGNAMGDGTTQWALFVVVSNFLSPFGRRKKARST